MPCSGSVDAAFGDSVSLCGDFCGRMERWRGRVAMVTGASSGIGAAIVYQLVDAGLIVVALARRVDKIPGAVSAAREEATARGRVAPVDPAPGQLHTRAMDLTSEEDIVECFRWVRDTFGGVDVLINNAGSTGETALTTGTDTENWRQIWSVNVLGLSICTRLAVQQMREREVDDGYIIHIGSIVGHITYLTNELSMYCATKHAVKVLAEGLRKELQTLNSHIRISIISPGLVKTELFNGYDSFEPEKWFTNSHLFPEDIADAVLYALGTPPHVQIQDMIVKPNGEMF